MTITRRRFLDGVGRAGGSGALYAVMQAMGLLAETPAQAEPVALAPGSGEGTSVVIIGAGIAGMTAAYELSKGGYAVTIVEARDRAGGRVWTVRGGTRIEETTGTVQTCRFDDGLYFNAGASRIPSHHRQILGYCKTFGVDLEIFIDANRNAFFQNDKILGGKPVRSRQLINDSRSYMAELLAKAIDRGALDRELSAVDKERMREFLTRFGRLDSDLRFRGSERSGFAVPPGAGDNPGSANQPLELRLLLDAEFWTWKMQHEEHLVHQATLLQPVGGMDRITAAFEQRVGHLIVSSAEVKRIDKTSNGVRVVYNDKRAGAEKAVDADYCICTIPLPVLARIDADFSPPVKGAVFGVRYNHVGKLAWQAGRRFWEEDHHIYGGITWTEHEIERFVYPSHGFHGGKGILVGATNHGEAARAFAKLSPEERAAAARLSGGRIHPGFEDEVSRPVSVAWRNIPHSLGGWAIWDVNGRRNAYQILNRPDGRIHFAGEHLSYLPGWQEGAVVSAQKTVVELHRQAQSLSR